MVDYSKYKDDQVLTVLGLIGSEYPSVYLRVSENKCIDKNIVVTIDGAEGIERSVDLLDGLEYDLRGDDLPDMIAHAGYIELCSKKINDYIAKNYRDFLAEAKDE